LPEGDTIARAARTLQRWLAGRAVTAARSTVPGLAAPTLVGDTVTAVEARGKHLLIRLGSGRVLHSHMRMTGSWHVYPSGQAWRLPAWRARVVLEAGPRTAVCFDAPVVELLGAGVERVHPGLRQLGPDVLVEPFDVADLLRRAAGRPAATTVGELLVDQRVVAGIGNIWRCEALFLGGLHPWRPLSSLEGAVVADVVARAAALMAAAVGPAPVRAGPGAADRLPAGQRWVYRRAGRPCRRCATLVRSARLGSSEVLVRTVYWCPSCQPDRWGGPPA